MAAETPKLAEPRRPSVQTCTGWAVVFFVLLRVAIGWHLAYEGCWKLQQDNWKADGYLKASSGPFRPLFLKLVDDVDGKERITEENMMKRMDERAKRAIEHYGLDETQAQIFKNFTERKKIGIQDPLNLKTIFNDPTFQQELSDYRLALAIQQYGDPAQPGPDANDAVKACLKDMTGCGTAILDRFPKILEDMDAQAKEGYGLAIQLTVKRLTEKKSAFEEQYKKAATQELKATIDNLGKTIKTLPQEMKTILSELPAIPPVPTMVPAQVAEFDGLHWLTPGFITGFIVDRYDNKLRDHYYWFPRDEKQFAKLEAKFGKLAATEIKETLEDYHQSIYGWRYREQKIHGADRDPNYIAAYYEEPIAPAAPHLKPLDSADSDIIKAYETAQQSDLELEIRDYLKLIEEIAAIEETGAEKSVGGFFRQERLLDLRKKKNASLAAILKRLEVPYNDLEPAKMETFNEEMFMNLSIDDQLKRSQVPPEPDSFKTKFVSYGNMWGLVIIGSCLILGLFTRLSAFAGAGLLLTYYLAMPPWPCWPEAPMSEGHYLIVNKNLIEILALLMIGCSGIGRWFGIDAVFGAMCSSKCKTKEAKA